MATDICFETLLPSIWKKELKSAKREMYCQMTGNFYNRNFKYIFNTEKYVTKQTNAHTQNVLNPTLLITHIFCICILFVFVM